MNLFLRFFITFIKCFFAKKQEILQPSLLQFRVLPLDCDINFHLTNSRYLSFMDLGRLYFISQFENLFKTTLKNRWLPVLAGCEISFIKPLKPLQKFTLSTRLLTWDEKYFYLEQAFMVKNTLHAIAIIRGTLLQKGKRVPMERILKTMGQNIERPLPPPSIAHWIAMNDAKKEQYTR